METVLLKIPDVMERLSVGQTKVYELMSSGELRSVKVGRCPPGAERRARALHGRARRHPPEPAAPDAETLHSSRFLTPCPQATEAALAHAELGESRWVPCPFAHLRALEESEPERRRIAVCRMWLKIQLSARGRLRRMVDGPTSPRANSEEPGMLRSRLVLATFLVVACAACSHGSGLAGPIPSAIVDHVGAHGADVFRASRARRLQRARSVRRTTRPSTEYDAFITPQRRVLRHRRDDRGRRRRSTSATPSTGRPRGATSRRSPTTTSPSPARPRRSGRSRSRSSSADRRGRRRRPPQVPRRVRPRREAERQEGRPAAVQGPARLHRPAREASRRGPVALGDRGAGRDMLRRAVGHVVAVRCCHLSSWCRRQSRPTIRRARRARTP